MMGVTNLYLQACNKELLCTVQASFLFLSIVIRSLYYCYLNTEYDLVISFYRSSLDSLVLIDQPVVTGTDDNGRGLTST